MANRSAEVRPKDSTAKGILVLGRIISLRKQASVKPECYLQLGKPGPGTTSGTTVRLLPGITEAHTLPATKSTDKRKGFESMRNAILLFFFLYLKIWIFVMIRWEVSLRWMENTKVVSVFIYVSAGCAGVTLGFLRILNMYQSNELSP